MSTKDARLQIRELKKQVRADNKEKDLLILKLFVLLIFLSVIAAVVNGKIAIPTDIWSSIGW